MYVCMYVTTYTTSSDQTDGMKLEVSLEAMCHKQTDDGRVVYITCIPTIAVAKFSKSTM